MYFKIKKILKDGRGNGTSYKNNRNDYNHLHEMGYTNRVNPCGEVTLSEFKEGTKFLDEYRDKPTNRRRLLLTLR